MYDIYRVHGSSLNIQAARRKDGQWFSRVQRRNGTWAKWLRCIEPTSYTINTYAGKARLPRSK